VQATIEGANVTVRGQVTGNVSAKRRLTLGGSGHLNGDVRVGRLTVEDGTLTLHYQSQPGDPTPSLAPRARSVLPKLK